MVRKNIRDELIIPVKETGLTIGANRNLGIKSKADIILFRDSDTYAPYNWRKLITRWFPEYDVVFGDIKILYKNYWQYCIDRFNFYKDKEGYISAANMAVKKDILKENPFPDENIGEDSVFINKLRSGHYRIKFDEEAFVYHFSEIKTYKKFIKRFKQYGYSASSGGIIDKLIKINPNLFIAMSPIISIAYALKITKNPFILPAMSLGLMHWCFSRYKWYKRNE